MKIAKPTTKLVNMDDIQQHPDNPRYHSREQIEELAASLDDHTYHIVSMLVSSRTGNIVIGNGMYSALRLREYEQVVVGWKDMTPEEELQILIRDNRLSELSSWIMPMLNADLSTLKDAGFKLEDMAFTMESMEELDAAELKRQRDNRVVKQDDAPEVDEGKPITQTGDLWLLGKHRVLCGDSTNEAAVERVMGGEEHIALFTDPPYGINRDPSWLDGVGTHRRAQASTDILIGDDGSLDLSFLWQYERRMVWGFPYIFDPLATGWIVWDKQPGLDERGIVTPIEMASTTLRKGFDIVRCMWGGYYREAGEAKREAHPTQKPLKVFAKFIEEYTDITDCIFDPFTGSGTVLMVADALDRKSANIEIAPKYCDVIVKRYINHAGTSDDVFVERDGKRLSWDEVQHLVIAGQKVHVC